MIRCYVNCLQHSQGLSLQLTHMQNSNKRYCGSGIHCYFGGLDPDFCGCVTVTFGVNIEYCASTGVSKKVSIAEKHWALMKNELHACQHIATKQVWPHIADLVTRLFLDSTSNILSYM